MQGRTIIDKYGVLMLTHCPEVQPADKLKANIASGWKKKSEHKIVRTPLSRTVMMIVLGIQGMN